MAGGIAEAFYGEVPEEIKQQALDKLGERLWDTTQGFCLRYC